MPPSRPTKPSTSLCLAGDPTDTELVYADCGSSHRIFSQPAESTTVALPLFGVADPTSNCTLDVFRFSFNAPLQAYAFGTAKQRLASDMAVTSVDAVTVRDITATLSPVAGLTVDQIVPEIVVARVPIGMLHGTVSGPGPVTMQVPTDPHFQVVLHVSATNHDDPSFPGTEVYALASGDLTIAVPAPLSVSAPADGATDLGPQSFDLQVNGADELGYIFNLLDGHTSSVAVYTTQTTVSTGELEVIGTALSPGASYTWTVQAIDGIASMDDLAGGAAAAARYGNRNSVVLFSGERTFTTAPTP